MKLPCLAIFLSVLLWPALFTPQAVGALTPDWAAIDPVVVSRLDPFSSCADSGPGTVFPGAAVEPMIAVNPRTRAPGARNLKDMVAALPRGFQALYAVPTGTAAQRASAIMTAHLAAP